MPYVALELSPGALRKADDDSCPFSQDSNTNGSTVTFDVTEGTSYKIAIFSYIKTIQGDFDLAAAYTG